jgi:hypothetical protein
MDRKLTGPWIEAESPCEHLHLVVSPSTITAVMQLDKPQYFNGLACDAGCDWKMTAEVWTAGVGGEYSPVLKFNHHRRKL